MKKKLTAAFRVTLLILLYQNVHAQSNDELLNLLTNKGIISAADADSIHNKVVKDTVEENNKQKTYNVFSSKFLQLGGFAHLRYQSNEEAGVADGFDIHRVRLDLKGAILPKLDYRLMIELAGAPKITDVYITCKPADFLKLQAGQFKIPFSLESNYADDKLELINRSQAVEALVARSNDIIGNQLGRDIGLMAFGSLFKRENRFLADYYLSILNGQGINGSDKNESKDFAGRILIHPWKGLILGSSAYSGYDFLTTSSKNIVRQRFGGEAEYSINKFALKSEYISGKDSSINKNGWYVQASWFIISQKFQAVLKYDSYDSNEATRSNTSLWLVAGLNYFFGDAAKIYLNYTNKREGENSKQIKNDLIAVQVQISF